jgi:hypothetical protein
LAARGLRLHFLAKDEEQEWGRRGIFGVSTSTTVLAFCDCEGEEEEGEDEDEDEGVEWEEGERQEEWERKEEKGERKEEREEALSGAVHPTTSEPRDTQQR